MIAPAQAPAWFVTGTDTEIGKTFITCALLHAFRAAGWRAAGMKPVAAGTEDGRNEDVEAILAASHAPLERRLVNPYLFDPPIAPHIAAAEAHVTIDPQVILAALAALRAQADAVLVEGVGGFRVPLSASVDTADLAHALRLPVILVVGLRLGCINHALLTAEAIRSRGLTLAGWVANQVDPAMARVNENVMAIAQRIDAPMLGRVPYLTQRDPAAAAACLQLPVAN